MAKREPPLRIPLDFETTVRGLLGTTPPPHDVTGSRKAKPRKRKAAKKRKAVRRG
jgi:hypothetical protein